VYLWFLSLGLLFFVLFICNLLVVVKVDLPPLGLALVVVNLQPIGWLLGDRCWRTGLGGNARGSVLQREWLCALLSCRHPALGLKAANKGSAVDL